MTREILAELGPGLRESSRIAELTVNIRIRWPWWLPAFMGWLLWRQWLGGCVNVAAASRFVVERGNVVHFA